MEDAVSVRLLGGLAVGVCAGMIGIGGGLVIVPALVYFFKMEQHTAQGTSLAILLPPSGLFAFIGYYRAGHVDVGLAIMIAIGVLAGGYFGGSWEQQLSGPMLRKLFAVMMGIIAVSTFFQK